jgi:hypothetical protein
MIGRAVLLATLTILAAGAPATARIVLVRIDRTEPFAHGTLFGKAGVYERVLGVANGELDPADKRNAGIVGLAQAPRNAAGKVGTRPTRSFCARSIPPRATTTCCSRCSTAATS